MKKALLILLLPAIFSSCENMRKQIVEMNELSSAIRKQFNFKDVGVNVNFTNGNKFLNISVINSPYNDSTNEAKQRIADSIGVMSLKYFHSVKFKDGSVSFVVSHKYGILNTSSSNGFSMHLR